MSDRRHFCCTQCRTGSKLIVLDQDWPRGHETDIQLECENCGTTRHEPDHGKSLAYYRHRNALLRSASGGDGGQR